MEGRGREDGRKEEVEMGGRRKGRWEEGGRGDGRKGGGDGRKGNGRKGNGRKVEREMGRKLEEVGHDMYTHGTRMVCVQVNMYIVYLPCMQHGQHTNSVDRTCRAEFLCLLPDITLN